MKVKKKVSGHIYTDNTEGWNVQTDYICRRIYLKPPSDADDDIDMIENFGKAILQAVQDLIKSNGD